MYYNEQSKFKTLKKNPNLTITRKRRHNGSLVLHSRGPLVTQYLDRIAGTLDKALNEFSEVIVYRFELRFPYWFDVDDLEKVSSNLITRFWASINSQVDSTAVSLNRDGYDIPYSRVRNIWCKESCRAGWTPHYHAALVLDADLFDKVFEAMQEDIFERIVKEAWARAINVPVYEVPKAAWIPENNIYRIIQDDFDSYEEAYKRLSYLAKSATKQYDDGSQWFGSSRC